VYYNRLVIITVFNNPSHWHWFGIQPHSILVYDLKVLTNILYHFDYSVSLVPQSYAHGPLVSVVT